MHAYKDFLYYSLRRFFLFLVRDRQLFERLLSTSNHCASRLTQMLCRVVARFVQKTDAHSSSQCRNGMRRVRRTTRHCGQLARKHGKAKKTCAKLDEIERR